MKKQSEDTSVPPGDERSNWETESEIRLSNYGLRYSAIKTPLKLGLLLPGCGGFEPSLDQMRFTKHLEE